MMAPGRPWQRERRSKLEYDCAEFEEKNTYISKDTLRELEEERIKAMICSILRIIYSMVIYT